MNVDGSWLTDVFASGAERPFAVVAFLVRWLGYAGVLIASGAAAFLMAVADRRDRALLTRITQRAAVAGIVAALLIIPLHAAQASGEGIVAMVRPDLLVTAASGSQGVQSLLQVLALAALLLALRSRADARPAPPANPRAPCSPDHGRPVQQLAEAWSFAIPSHQWQSSATF